MFRLDGRVALITGAGQGIGLATARALAVQGADVALNDLDPARAEAATRVIAALGGRTVAVPADVIDETEVAAMVERCVAELGGLDILVNNAGGSGGSAGPIEALSLDAWERVQRLNVTSAFLCIRAALPHLKRRGGRIVNVSSLAGVSRSIIGGAAYASAKAAVLGLTRHLSGELGPYGITVNAVAPGLTFTERVEATFAARPEADRQVTLGRIPLGRAGAPEDPAAAVAFLCSDEAAYITGATVDVNGGINVR
ncbi:MAG: SDR family oxidoreductase [Chloroflexota bacterium]|nr:SDR family oxidoreductase [Chloroflexota bacterium]